MRVLERSATRWSKRARIIATTGLFVFAAIVAPFASVSITQAAGENLSTVANKTGTLSSPVAITDLQITGTGDDAVSITVSAPTGYFEVANSVAEVSGESTNLVTLTGLRSEVNTSLSSLTYHAAEYGTVTVDVEYGNSVGNVIFNDGEGGNGHAYIVVNDPLPWTEAAEAAENYTYGGQTGYLATIASPQENTFVYDALNQQTGWIGASDAAVEGQWRWLVGPEAGTQFWSGDFEGSSFNDEYSNWDPGEPNNSDSSEHCAQFYDGGYWNDLSCLTARPYVVEFGTQDAFESIETSFTVTTIRNTIEVATCDELADITDSSYIDNITLTQDIDCEGRTLNPLFVEDAYEATFDGAGFTIRNFVINQPVDSGAALIERVDGATVRNLTIENAHIIGQDQTAVLIGASNGGVTIENVAVRNSSVVAASSEDDTDSDDVGGLIGEITIANVQTVVISGSSFEGTITVVDGSSVGGIIGSLNADESVVSTSVLIEKTYSDARISVDSNEIYSGENEYTGGLIGHLTASAFENDFSVILRDVYSWSSISHATEDTVSFGTGGLVGYVYAASTEVNSPTILIQRAYANGSIQALGAIGGLVGVIEHDAYSPDGGSVQIENSFAAGKVISSDGFAGAVIGISDAATAWNGVPYHLALTNVYFDQTATGLAQCAPDYELVGCSAVNTDGNQPNLFINNTANEPIITWDFEGLWVRNTHQMPTFSPVVERDGDGVDDAVEVTAPNNGDGNNDGTQDANQSNVASLVDTATNEYVTLAVDASCSLSDVSVSTAASHESTDTQYAYTTGFVNFTATGCADDSTNVQVYYHSVSSEGLVARKFNPITNQYFTITAATINAAAAPLSGTVVSYTIVDNGELDVNDAIGVITDPVALADINAAVVGAPNTGFGGQNSTLLFTAFGIAGVGVLVGLAVIFRKTLTGLFTTKK